MTANAVSTRYVRYPTPSEDGEKLCVPPWNQLENLLSANVLQRAKSTIEISGQPLPNLAREARKAILVLARDYTRSYADTEIAAEAAGPLIVSGHQPNLTHPGVWLKSFATARLAQSNGGIAINLLIDSDVCTAASIRVPTGTVASPRVETIPLDQPTDAMPYEERPIVDAATWRGVSQRVEQAIAPLGIQPWIRQWWPMVVAGSERNQKLGLALAQAQHKSQTAWQSHSLELPLSSVCQTTAFRRFAVHLLGNLVSFRQAYNESLHEFRRLHHLRNNAQPMPDLGESEGWLETPFWIWSAEDPRRRALFAKPDADGWQLADREGFQQPMPRAPEDGIEMLAGWEARGIKLRPRALVTTMFARLVLADLFIHGIGGARYDQVTDALCERFFGHVPPAHATISGTLRLPIETDTQHPSSAREIRRQLRELTYHPEAHLEAVDLDNGQQKSIASAVQQKKTWIATPKIPSNAAYRHRQIHSANESLQKWLEEKRSTLQHALTEFERKRRADLILRSREYASCLFPHEVLQEFLLDFGEVKA